MAKCLILFDTDRIKDYIFSTNKLTEVRGASAILESLNTVATPQKIKGMCKEAEIIYSNGGSTLIVAPELNADSIIREIEKLYRRQAVGASISGEKIAYEEGGNGGIPFGHLVRELATRLRKVKDEKPAETPMPMSQWFQICSSCGRYPASVVPTGEAESSPPVCQPCNDKRVRGRAQRNIFWEGDPWWKRDQEYHREAFLDAAFHKGDRRWHDEAPEDGGAGMFPQDMGEIGSTSTIPGYVGFLYADGNGMGRVLDRLRYKHEYFNFARDVDRLTRDVVHQALLRRAEPRMVGGREIAPFEILLVGGDDFMLVTAADLAVDVATDILGDYEAKSKEKTGHDLTVSLGLVLAHANFPMYAMRDLAADLLKSAKKQSGSAIDFTVITAAGSRDLAYLRNDALTERSFLIRPAQENRHYRLTGCPYSLSEFKSLRKHAGKLKAEGFPRSQLQAMYEGLFMGVGEAHLRAITVLGRASRAHHEALDGFFREFCPRHREVPLPWTFEERRAPDAL